MKSFALQTVTKMCQ